MKVWGGSPSTGGFAATRASKTQNRTSLGTVLEAQTAWAFGIILARLFSARRIRGDDEFRIVRVHRQRAGNDDLARQIACVIQYILEAENGSRSTWLGSPTLGNRPLLRNLRLQPKTAFSRLPPVQRADLKGQLRVQRSFCRRSSRTPARGATVAFRLRPQTGASRFVVPADRWDPA